jgi:hypothetical protein
VTSIHQDILKEVEMKLIKEVRWWKRIKVWNQYKATLKPKLSRENSS